MMSRDQFRSVASTSHVVRVFVALAVLALPLANVSVAHAQQESGISVVGEGRVIATPDLALGRFLTRPCSRQVVS